MHIFQIGKFNINCAIADPVDVPLHQTRIFFDLWLNWMFIELFLAYSLDPVGVGKLVRKSIKVAQLDIYFVSRWGWRWQRQWRAYTVLPNIWKTQDWGSKRGDFESPPPKQCIWRKVLLKVLIKENVQNCVWIVWIPMLIASYSDKHWRRSGIYFLSFRSIFLEKKANSILTPSLMAVFPKTFLTLQDKVHVFSSLSLI